jgi:16S rRNA (cytosine967-C5)-methyltransferase
MRKEIYQIYREVTRNEGYLNVLIQNSQNITPQMTNILYQTVRNKLLIDYIIDKQLGKSKTKSSTKDILRLATCEILLTNNQANFAIINEWVEISKQSSNQFEANKVNSVLRAVIDVDVEVELQQIKNRKIQTSLKYSIPLELLEYVQKTNGIKGINTLTNIMDNKVANYARINRKQVSNPGQLILELEEYQAVLVEEYLIEYKGDITKSKAFIDGKLYIQNYSPYLAFEKSIFQKNDIRVLDMCAAPGGKTAHIIDQFSSKNSKIIANEINEHKIRKIEDNLSRQKMNGYTLINNDALDLLNIYEKNSFDIVVLDAPCSGLGVIGHKPDIKYTMNKSKIEKLIELQKKLIKVAYELVKPDGYVVYSTCTINKQENQEISNEYNVIEEELITKSDGFYIAIIKK